jgi:glycerol-3-phosphate dehydrogenase
MKSREEHLKELRSGAEYDILIIGGGANGAGVVLDAASRGLKCAIVDSYDFAAGTSSKSTKMAHGGIRYF